MLPDSKESRLTGHVLGQLSALILAGAALGFLYGVVQPQDRWAVAFNGAVTALASAAAGGFLGLLFGVPRALAVSAPASTPDLSTAGVGGYGANTNLEEVSDWLTKLLVGAGLTQLIRVPAALQNLGLYLRPGLGGGPGASSFAIALVIYGFLVGFFLAFLAARLKLGAAFKQADELAQSKPAVDAKISSLPPAPVGPTMFAVPQNDTVEAKAAALKLSHQIQAIETHTPGSSFGPDAYRRVAQEMVAATLYDQAIQFLESGAKQHPEDPSLPLFIGAIYGMYKENYDVAEQNYFKALGLKPLYAPAFYNLACNSARRAKLADEKRNLSEAREYLTKAFELDPRLRAQSAKDPVWDGVRTSAELSGLLTT